MSDLVGNPEDRFSQNEAQIKIYNVSSFESIENTQRQSVGHIAKFRIMNPHQ